MKTTPVTEHLTQLTKLHFVNAFLVREDDGFTLVDTTMGRSAKGLIEAASSAGAPIRRIALTHGHGDHVGLLDALRDSLGSDVEVLVPELDEQILAGEKPKASSPAAGRRSARAPTGGSARATASAASRSSRRRATRPGTSRTWTRAIAR